MSQNPSEPVCQPLGIVMPVRNEADIIDQTLSRLGYLREYDIPLWIVDGESDDETADIARASGHHTIAAPPGRGRQLRAGLALVDTEWVLFLHADNRFEEVHLAALLDAIAEGCDWGYFPVRLAGRHPAFRVIERGINTRSRLTSIATGDQCLFFRTEFLREIGGVANLPIMEDLDICRRARKLASPARLKPPVQTSSRRWERSGIVRTTLLMWYLRGRFFLGSDAETLADLYRDVR